MTDVNNYLLVKETERKIKNKEIRQKKGLFAAMDHLVQTKNSEKSDVKEAQRELNKETDPLEFE